MKKIRKCGIACTMIWRAGHMWHNQVLPIWRPNVDEKKGKWL